MLLLLLLLPFVQMSRFVVMDEEGLPASTPLLPDADLEADDLSDDGLRWSVEACRWRAAMRSASVEEPGGI